MDLCMRTDLCTVYSRMQYDQDTHYHLSNQQRVLVQFEEQL